MPVYQYGATMIEWQFQKRPELKRHYVTVERNRPVLLRGPAVSEQEQQKLIRYRARWIKLKLEEVNQPVKDEFVTGSRLLYRGKSWYCQVEPALELKKPIISFNHSKFFIQSPEGRSLSKKALREARDVFFRQKAKDKLIPRIRHWQRQTGLEAVATRLHRFPRRWASCAEQNILEFHPRCMEFSPAVLDYVIVHELCHTVEKSHNQAFWKLVALHYPDWERCHAEVERLGVEV
ncbi:M48 family metallopeptidase [Sansalvadorimonas sp. 2012CJ34-2]|uniref:M48 family metallopeptidase n=1 Tax=Parendozoicomonas callyspongiae TaxID=2942213 RepID=A0ABT0PL93_9GAMM|nr:SprT family zinc-dependent metalloprotease [Sansalvadorimonas sp. 2012CJ34-2]MCL6272147.1 M48 family metallopeptidase [Sansalvadorimonas sp. 2012CJ34-2]